ncbi:phage tail tape measure protein [Klebsiella pneumoniae]|uniref:phage tail tape measure protein n=1 Tax=Klebsiella pneumoniae TaxID=573 RepID=UPI0007CA1DE0|nr:phage tail tape measure protein [Klebsiella pneumoniae]HCD1380263.1 phage tail tape measure protein [Klebsiella pneumoniae subsp. pneumoniae]EIX9133891.1 phage tail tape measure protein [Klebsiella pneumoniae]EJD6385704.1 phage tail tape measure protein [Klebsiella pneumoniae]SAR76762.1 Prophage tail length tape measure [Klebsiella pneumoniae]HCD1388759.1 phage tail tape measure protein [Klebsiella pneumoniae subsp. pneumoniae]
MAGKSLGTLTIDLIARTGGFVQGMDKAERSSQKWRDNVKKDAAAVGSALAAVGTAAAAAAIGVSAAGIALVKNTSEQITETDRWAKSLKMSTQDLLSWQFAAEKAGLTGDNIADIFKDINDKVGDAVLNKSGEAAQALDTLGLSAEKLAQQSPDKQLLAISSALQKIPSQAGKTNILESLGNDLSKMLPLFDNNNEKLKQFIQLSKDFGVAPPQEDIDNLVKVNQFFQDIESSAQGLKIEIASGLAKVDLSPIQDGLDDIRDVFTDPAVLSGLAKLVGGMAELVGWMGKLSSESANFLSHIFEVPDRFKAGGWYEFEKNQRLGAIADTLQSDLGVITKPSSNSELPINNNLLPGQSNQKQTQKPDAEAKKLESAYKAVEQSYLKQIALVDQLTGKTKDATEVEKLHFDLVSGRLVGINKEQQIRLEGLAAEIDKYNALSKFRDLQDDLLTPEEKLLKTTKERFEVLKDIQGMTGISPEDYEKASKAISKSSITDAPQFQGIDAAVGGAGGELIKTAEAQKEQEKWYNKQLEMQKALLDQKVINEQEYADRITDINKTNNEKMESIQSAYGLSSVAMFADMTSQSAQLLQGLGKEGSAAYKTLFIASKAAAIAQSIISTEVAAAKALELGPIFGIPASVAIRAVGYAGTAIIGAQTIAGMAHDGIDAVPETGTWLLQKGERVVTANTSAKLDATLNRVSQESTSGNQISQEFHFNVNGDPSDVQIAMMKKAAADGARMGYQQVVDSVVKGQGNLHRALMTKTNSGRKIR